MRCYVYILLFFLFLSSCSNEKKEKISYLKKVAVQTIGKHLIIPDKSKLFDPFSVVSDSIENFDKEYKIYTNIDVSCGTCIKSISKWNKFYNSLDRDKTSIVLVCNSSDRFESFMFFCEDEVSIEDTSFPFIFDFNNEFKKINGFMQVDFQYETVLTDNENRILLLGNPIYSEKIRQLYLDKIMQ